MKMYKAFLFILGLSCFTAHAGKEKKLAARFTPAGHFAATSSEHMRREPTPEQRMALRKAYISIKQQKEKLRSVLQDTSLRHLATAFSSLANTLSVEPSEKLPTPPTPHKGLVQELREINTLCTSRLDKVADNNLKKLPWVSMQICSIIIEINPSFKEDTDLANLLRETCEALDFLANRAEEITKLSALNLTKKQFVFVDMPDSPIITCPPSTPADTDLAMSSSVDEDKENA